MPCFSNGRIRGNRGDKIGNDFVFFCVIPLIFQEFYPNIQEYSKMVDGQQKTEIKIIQMYGKKDYIDGTIK
ncbi:MAG TPA: hypothetical protein DIS85_08925 [Vagococcus sp.]|nr:hypothetical protein [Vagococcus sp.]